MHLMCVSYIQIQEYALIRELLWRYPTKGHILYPKASGSVG